MLVGHFALGFAAKRVTSRVPLGTLVLVAMLADFLWPILCLVGLENVEFGQGRGAASYVRGFSAPFSHSLVMLAVWGALIALCRPRSRSRREQVTLWLLVVSHWILDAISHRPDMPLVPGVNLVAGLGLWTSVPWTLAIEGGFWAAALLCYARVERPRTASGRYGLWTGAALLTLIWHNNITGPAPPSARFAAIGSLVTFSLFVTWTYWIGHSRCRSEA